MKTQGQGWPMSERAKLVLALLPAQGTISRADFNKLARERLSLNAKQVSAVLTSLLARKLVTWQETRPSHTWGRAPLAK